MANVNVISSCVIRMEGNNTNPISRLDLTLWDLQWLSLDPIQKGILFKNPQSKHTLIPHLKASLSRALDFFPPLAGRLSTTAHDDGTISYFLNCNNAGVKFVHAIAAATSVSDILEPKYIPKIVTSLFAGIGSPNSEGISKPLLAVQVTELIDGVFIALTANHVVVDGVSFWHFFNSWSEISRGSNTVSKTPVFERWYNVRPLRLAPLEKSSSVPPLPPLLQRVFHFSKQTLSNLKAKANSEASTDKISSLQAISAHIWRAVSRHRYSGISLDDLSGREDPLVLAVGTRARVPLPDGYFGGAVINAKLNMSAAELVGKGIGHVAARINELVAQHNKEAILKIMEDWENCPTLLRRGAYSFVISSSPRHNVYGNDFGWGKPVAVRSGAGQKFDGKLTLFPAPEKGGINVEVCLEAQTLQAMEHDAEFMQCSPPPSPAAGEKQLRSTTSPSPPEGLPFQQTNPIPSQSQGQFRSPTDKISSLQAMSAHLWRGASRQRHPGISLDDLSGREEPLDTLVGSRPRIPLPDGYFGGAAINAMMTMSAAELVGKGIGHVAARINELVAQHSKEAILKIMEDWEKCPTLLRRGTYYSLIIPSSPRHNVYGCDFGLGKPVAVRSGPGQKSDGKMTLFPAPEGGGIDVEVCLAPEMLKAMERDSQFIGAFVV
ncbi:uncharacterized acetyltransferase At3g50280-like [Salvia hispanica]|uniref:uncharacterized acetyltransferase At3g50280-like n=1 Tax=Salvia hispanica TaxID=49212 RepID=UPI0020090CBE|nr:uncharacterized acetyltransferase At3g50280-like [Salvia hispanica]